MRLGSLHRCGRMFPDGSICGLEQKHPRPTRTCVFCAVELGLEFENQHERDLERIMQMAEDCAGMHRYRTRADARKKGRAFPCTHCEGWHVKRKKVEA